MRDYRDEIDSNLHKVVSDYRLLRDSGYIESTLNDKNGRENGFGRSEITIGGNYNEKK